MLICVEGCIGVGKSTLVKTIEKYVYCHTLFEEYDSNPFLADFYQDQSNYALHVQCVFMLLQEKILKRSWEFPNRELVVTDFHPIKSRIFSSIILDEQDIDITLRLYSRLFNSYPSPSLMIYLRTSADILLSRINQRDDIYTRDIDPSYIDVILERYDAFFESYTGELLIIDNSRLDYRIGGDHIENLLHLINSKVELTQYLRASPL